MPIKALSNKILSLWFFLRIPIPTIFFKPTQGVFGATICAHVGIFARGQGFESYLNHHFLRHSIRSAFFVGVFFSSLVGVSILFLSVQVLERFIRATKKVRNGLFSLTANFARSKNYFMRYLARKLSFKSCALKNRSLAGEHKTTILI